MGGFQPAVRNSMSNYPSSGGTPYGTNPQLGAAAGQAAGQMAGSQMGTAAGQVAGQMGGDNISSLPGARLDPSAYFSSPSGGWGGGAPSSGDGGFGSGGLTSYDPNNPDPGMILGSGDPGATTGDGPDSGIGPRGGNPVDQPGGGPWGGSPVGPVDGPAGGGMGLSHEQRQQRKQDARQNPKPPMGTPTPGGGLMGGGKPGGPPRHGGPQTWVPPSGSVPTPY